MAENQPAKKRRRVKPESTETLRERTEKASQKVSAEPKPKRLTSVRAFGRGFFAPLRFVGRVLTWLGRHLIPRYFRNSFKELRLVTWPNRKQSRQLTFAVVVFAIVFAIFVSLLDYGLDKVFRRILLK